MKKYLGLSNIFGRHEYKGLKISIRGMWKVKIREPGIEPCGTLLRRAYGELGRDH